MSKSSVSLWVRDLPRPARLSYKECVARPKACANTGRPSVASAKLAREAARAAAAAQIGALSDREVLIAGAIAYWCEGAKSKPYRRDDHVIFMNSDPALTEEHGRQLPRLPAC